MTRPARFLVLAGAVTVLGFGAQLAPDLLGRIPLFDLDRLEFEGLVHLDRAQAEALAAAPEGFSIWDDLDSLAAGLRRHPLVRELRVRRRLPSTVVIEIQERRPVALHAGPTLTPVDREGGELPIDPARHRLDLPLLHTESRSEADAAENVAAARERRRRILAREIARIEEFEPRMAAVVSDAALDRWGDVRLRLANPRLELQYTPPISPARLRQAVAILTDALEREPERTLLAIDLRFADQVVARYASSPSR